MVYLFVTLFSDPFNSRNKMYDIDIVHICLFLYSG